MRFGEAEHEVVIAHLFGDELGFGVGDFVEPVARSIEVLAAHFPKCEEDEFVAEVKENGERGEEDADDAPCDFALGYEIDSTDDEECGDDYFDVFIHFLGC